MTDNELITEFILQGIKQNDIVKIFLKGERVITGYILDKDVFRVDFNEDLRAAILKSTQNESYKNNSQITISEIREKTNLEKEILEDSMLNFGLLPMPASTFYVKDIAAIKKVNE